MKIKTNVLSKILILSISISLLLASFMTFAEEPYEDDEVPSDAILISNMHRISEIPVPARNNRGFRMESFEVKNIIGVYNNTNSYTIYYCYQVIGELQQNVAREGCAQDISLKKLVNEKWIMHFPLENPRKKVKDWMVVFKY